MEKSKIERINALAAKAKTTALSPAEKEEQAALRQAYLAEVRANIRLQLENTVIEEPDGTRHKVKPRS